MRGRFAFFIVLTALFSPASVTQAVTTIGFGAVGDSYTAEHRWDNNSRQNHRNWVEQLGLGADVGTGVYNFGTFLPSSPNHGNPRFRGFEYNWGVSGATTHAALSNGQFSGLMSQVDATSSSPDVEIAVISLGINNWGGFLGTSDPLNPTESQSISDESTVVFGHLQSMVNDLLSVNSDVKIVLSNIVDRSIWPQYDLNTTQARKDAVSTAIGNTNTNLTAWANGLGIPVIDAAKLTTDLLASPGFAGQTLTTDTAPGDTSEGALSLWADDGHPGTVWHGLFANTVLTGLDLAYGGDFGPTDLPLLTNQQILNNAFFKNTGNAPTATGDAFDYASYVLLAELLAGDFDGSGDVGQGDLALVLDNWGTLVADGESPDPVNWINADDVTASLIGQDELALVLQNWGNTSAILAELDNIVSVTDLTDEQIINLIPEPASVALVLCGLAGGLMSRRRA